MTARTAHIPLNGNATMIPVDAYPPLIAKGREAEALQALRGDTIAQRAQAVFRAQHPALRDAVLTYIDDIREAGREGDTARMYALAHETRGLAATAGLGATGRLADGLCQYLDTLWRLGGEAETAILSLHIDAMVRAARAEKEAGELGETVAQELSELVARRVGGL